MPTEFHILGPLEVVAARGRVSIRAAKQRALLAILLLHRNEVLSADRLIDELWGDRPPKTARKTLQVHVSHLRRVLGPGVLLTRPSGYLLRVEPEQLDLEQFERLAEQARRAAPATAVKQLREALGLWRGAPLSDLAHETFARGEIARLEELRLSALEDRIDADLALGHHLESVGELEALAVAHPLRERVRGQLMLALYRSGRQADALEIYREARAALVEELGIEPGRELRDLERAILLQEPSLDAPAPMAAATEPAVGATGGAASFVGREAELAELLAGLDDALLGRGGLVLMAGEPGIGKSRLATEFADQAKERGALVLSGRCWEAGGAAAYWPWVQSLRSHLRSADPDALRAHLGTGAAAIAQMLPELRELMPDVPPPPSIESEGARFRLFDATASFLRNAASATPLVLVLDDLQSADTPSLLLLQFVAGQVADMKILIVGAYRDVELPRDHPLLSTLAELHRHDTTRWLRLTGLTELDVSRYIELTTEVDSAEALAAAVHGQTEGNPLFVEEVVRLLAAEGRLDDLGDEAPSRPTLPPTVKEVIAQRLAHLPDSCTDLLMQAAVLGREFSLTALGRIGDGDELLEVLDPAIAAHVVVEVPELRGRLRFSHGLVRDALYEDLPRGGRARTHRRIGQVLERLYMAQPEAHFAELSYHFFEGAQSGDADKAVLYSRLAGDQAGASLAYEEAVRLYRMGLEVLAGQEPLDEEARCDLLLAMGEAQMRAGDGGRAKESFWRAAGIARRERFGGRLARAALGYGGRFVWSRAGSDRRIVPLLEEAVSALDDADSDMRARLLARLSGALRDPPFRDRAAAVSRQAVDMARRLGDPATLAYALDARHVVIWGPDTAEERVAIAGELARLAAEADDEERTFQGHFWRLESLLELGDLPSVRTELRAAARSAEELKQPAQLWYVAVTEALLALLEGSFVEAERRIEKALGLGQEAQSWEALAYYRLQLYSLRSAQGRLDEFESTIQRSVDEYPRYPVFRCVLAALYRELDLRAQAASVFEELAAEDFAAVPRDEEWLFGMTLLAPVAEFLGDERRSARLYELLAPYGNRNVVSVPDVAAGSVSRSLGVLAGATGRWDEATRHFEDALAMNARMDARPWVARTQHDHARMLLTRNAPGDDESADALLSRALDGYRALGMTAWELRVSEERPRSGSGRG